jgi:FAD synthase
VLRGGVEHGDARGRELGFATANMALAPHQAIPQIGIYAGAARTNDGLWHAAAISVGTRPQFYEDGPLLVEVHLPDFNADLYGQRLDVAFLARLRGEMTFEDVDGAGGANRRRCGANARDIQEVLAFRTLSC